MFPIHIKYVFKYKLNKIASICEAKACLHHINLLSTKNSLNIL